MSKATRLVDIAVIGGGAAGYMAAISCARRVAAVKDNADGVRHEGKKAPVIVILEKNREPLKKIYATGNGRCNFLNANAVAGSFMSDETPGSIHNTVRHIIKANGPSRLIEEFETIGVLGAEEEGGRLYPRSFQAKSVAAALLAEASALGIEFVGEFAVSSITRADGSFVIESRGGNVVEAAIAILATGGKAGCQYGSEGDGYKLASSLEHTVIKPIPALTPLLCTEDIEALAGVRVRASVSLLSDEGGAISVLAEDEGEVQLTKNSISGICTFNISRYLRQKEGTVFRVDLDFFPEWGQEELKELLMERRIAFPDRMADMLFLSILPDKLSLYILKRVGIDTGSTIRSISVKQLEALALSCKALSFQIKGSGSWKDSQTTAGGVALSEVDADTLESQKQHDLFLAGELLDADGPCGGYNLTWAFASGRAAGFGAALRYTD